MFKNQVVPTEAVLCSRTCNLCSLFYDQGVLYVCPGAVGMQAI